MNNKPQKPMLRCPNEACYATAKDTSKERNRFLRRHVRDGVCINFQRKQGLTR